MAQSSNTTAAYVLGGGSPSGDDGRGDFIKWERKFELGIPKIDAQHRRLVEMCNELRAAIMGGGRQNGAWERPLIDALHECAAYVQTHFRDEETLMRAAGYTGYERHKREHEQFTRTVLETARGFDHVSITSALRFVRFLYDWILSHIAHEDILIAAPVREYLERRRAQGLA